jgi:hypothetical protein
MMKRREIIAGLAGAAVWPVAVRGQQTAMAVIGYLGPESPSAFASRAREVGLLSNGIVPADNFLRAAAYVDRILKGSRPGELPVQVPTKFNLVLYSQDRENARIGNTPKVARNRRRVN